MFCLPYLTLFDGAIAYTIANRYRQRLYPMSDITHTCARPLPLLRP